MRQNYLNKLIGNTHSVLWETRNGTNGWIGYTDNFIRVELNSDKNLDNKISNIIITGVAPDADHCIAELN